MKPNHILAVLMSLIFLSGCEHMSSTSTSPQARPAAQIEPSERRLKAHLRFLADDLLQGRETGSAGHQLASLYIATEFEKYGLQPAGEHGSYFQEVRFRQASLIQSSPAVTLSSSAGTIELNYPADYITSASVVTERSAVAGELIFVGYGIVAPELEHNDYRDLDVEGKIVVALAGKPAFFPSEEGAHFASSRQKKAYAATRGATGFITISTPTAEKVRPYQNLLNYLHMPRLAWVDEHGQAANIEPRLGMSAYFSKAAAQKLFDGAAQTLEQIYQQLEADHVPAGFALPGHIAMRKQSEHRDISSPNVIGMLPGSDPLLRNEYVLYSAHSDHIGLAKTVKKDNINNGAMDNAAGVATMLETARMFSEMATPVRRSILFVAVTGEEKGLLGSDYFARNPTVPASQIVANVNLDMPILTYEFADVIAFGANHSDMGESVAHAAENSGITLSADPWPEQALFTRSDHYSFVKQGIPSVFLVPGLKSADAQVDGANQFGLFLANHYHQPSDDFNQAFNWKAATKFTEVNWQIGKTLANQTKRPTWNENDFFGNTFANK